MSERQESDWTTGCTGCVHFRSDADPAVGRRVTTSACTAGTCDEAEWDRRRPKLQGYLPTFTDQDCDSFERRSESQAHHDAAAEIDAELLPGQARCGNCYHCAGDGCTFDDKPYLGTGRCEMPGFVGYGRHLDSYWYCDTGQFQRREGTPVDAHGAEAQYTGDAGTAF
jgi:hypothetical protein